MAEITTIDSAEDAGWSIIDSRTGRVRMANLAEEGESGEDAWFCLTCDVRLDGPDDECANFCRSSSEVLHGL